MKRLFIFLLCMVAFFSAALIIKADELDDISKELATLNSQLKEKEANFDKVNSQLTGIKNRVVSVENEIVQKEKDVKKGEKVLAYQKSLLNARAKSYYKNIHKNANSLLGLLVGENLSASLQNFFYQKTVVDEDRNTIIKIVLYIRGLEDKKKELVSEKARLAVIKEEVDRQAQVLGADISTTRGKIAQLSAQQQSLIATKLASLNIPRSAGTSARGCTDDRGVDPGFSPRLALFTYGAPHRVGLNQYGAKGRAEAGQPFDTILRAYFNFDEIKDVPNVRIRVDGGQEYDLEEYMRGIREMPASWSQEALKAQAIAARSYAMAYTNNGSGSICATESCQVFSPPGDRNDGWTQAVAATQGKVMAQGGNPIKAWFASTHGGYVFSSAEVWGGATSYTKHATDTTSGSAGSFEDLQSNAYDRSSPWFYCDWGARGEYSNTAWLKPSEVADIINVILLVRADPSKGCYVYQTDKAPPPPDPSKGCSATDNWSADKVKSELRAKGGNPLDSVTDVSISGDFGAGRTTTVSVGGAPPISGSEFKDWFNLRAPANIQIVGPLFNVERR